MYLFNKELVKNLAWNAKMEIVINAKKIINLIRINVFLLLI